jgi:asparagine synthase (glutamine-hydrolysing)
MDSSVLCALIRPHVETVHSFSVGIKGSPDLAFARQVADALKTEHHELVVNQDELIAIMPQAIYCLESFDALLVRSSLMNYLVGELASRYVLAVFSGEAGDELFAGYDYLKTLETSDLPGELLDIQGRLHNTAFQRVDRSSSGHGIIANLPFADPEVVQYARTIPPELLIKDGISKWILRYALRGKLPDEVLWRGKFKFWEGSGVNDLLAQTADASITDTQYEKERTLPNGWTLHSKEELMYYRIFKERFGELKNLDWMGRTKGA